MIAENKTLNIFAPPCWFIASSALLGQKWWRYGLHDMILIKWEWLFVARCGEVELRNGLWELAQPALCFSRKLNFRWWGFLTTD